MIVNVLFLGGSLFVAVAVAALSLLSARGVDFWERW